MSSVREYKIEASNFLSEKLESGYCTQSEWDNFCTTYEKAYGYVPKLYGDDIKIIEDTVSLDCMEFENPNGFHATITVEQGAKSKIYILRVTDVATEKVVFHETYPTLSGCKICMGRRFPGWIYPDAA